MGPHPSELSERLLVMGQGHKSAVSGCLAVESEQAMHSPQIDVWSGLPGTGAGLVSGGLTRWRMDLLVSVGHFIRRPIC